MKITEVTSNDIIKVCLDFNKHTKEEINNICKTLETVFPDNTVLILPNDANISISNWNEIYDYVMSIKPNHGILAETNNKVRSGQDN